MKQSKPLLKQEIDVPPAASTKVAAKRLQVKADVKLPMIDTNGQDITDPQTEIDRHKALMNNGHGPTTEKPIVRHMGGFAVTRKKPAVDHDPITLEVSDPAGVVRSVASVESAKELLEVFKQPSGYLFKVYTSHYNGKVAVKLWLQIVFKLEEADGYLVLRGHTSASNTEKGLRKRLWKNIGMMVKRRLKGSVVELSPYAGSRPSDASQLWISIK